MRLTPEVGVPRLERGGKYVFGWSVIRPAGAVPLPPEAVSEYGLPADGPLVVLSGSRSSRGMRVALPSRLEGTVFDPLLATPRGDGLLRLKNASMAEARIEGCVMSIPAVAMKVFGLSAGDRLLVIRGSNLAFVMALTGPLVEIGLRHPEIEVFG